MSIRSIHQKLGTAGFIISIVALVAALGGSAFAAKGALTHKQKKEVAKIAKKEVKKIAQKEAKKFAKVGPQGPQGAPGSAGAKGDTGGKGDTGAKGANGANGTNGGPGPEGPEGPEGSPWTLNGTLPSGATETGVWGSGEGDTAGKHFYSASFMVPLQEPLTNTKAVVVNSSEDSKPGCPGRGASGVAEAEPGFFCVYVGPEEGGTVERLIRYIETPLEEWEYVTGAGATGAVIWVNCSAACFIGGTWAVTAE